MAEKKSEVIEKEKMQTEQKEVKAEETKPEKEKKTEKKKEEKQKKYEAVVKAFSLPISKKHSMYISKAIKGMTMDEAIQYLQRVTALKQAVPFKGEIPHRKGMMSGRYPVKAAQHFINLLKALKGNAIVNNLELEKTKITESISNWASRPLKSGGRKAKRTNIVVKAKEISIMGEEIK